MKKFAKVIDIKDENKLGRVKVEIIPELQGFPVSLLPWANPVQKFDSNTDFEKHVPSEGSYIIVDVDSTWTVFSYDNTRPFSDSIDGANAAYEFLSNNLKLYNSTDPEPLDLDFSKDPDFLKFKDSTTGEAGLIFSNGRYLYWSGKDGKTLVYGFQDKKYFELKEDSSFKYENPDKNTVIEVDASGNVKVNCQNATKIEMNDSSIKINCKDSTKIEMDSSQVKINDNNLVILK